MKQVYISGPLTGLDAAVGKNLRKLYETLAAIARNVGWDPYVPHLHTDPMTTQAMSAHEVYVRDRRAVFGSEAVVAYVGLPSLGVGMELELARVACCPVCLLWEPGQRVSRMVLGSPGVSESILLEDDWAERVTWWLRGLP